MSGPLQALTAKLQAAAQKPQQVFERKIVDYSLKTLALSARDSRGNARPVVRQTLAQQRQMESFGRNQAIESVRQEVLAQAQEELTP